MDKHKYDDIINLPHYQSKTRNKMSMHDRAAQFSPFAALTGHSEAIAETARLTKNKKELTAEENNNISQKLIFLRDVFQFKMPVVITFFVSDKRKNGGEYYTSCCRITRLLENEKILFTDKGDIISLEDIYSIESDAFDE